MTNESNQSLDENLQTAATVGTFPAVSPTSAQAKPSEVIERAIYMLKVAADHCEEHAAEETAFYDNAICDGGCVAEDCRAAAEGLTFQPPKQSVFAEKVRFIIRAEMDRHPQYRTEGVVAKCHELLEMLGEAIQ